MTVDLVRDQDLYSRSRDVKFNKTLKEVKKTLPRESSFAGNLYPCKATGPKPRKIGL